MAIMLQWNLFSRKNEFVDGEGKGETVAILAERFKNLEAKLRLYLGFLAILAAVVLGAATILVAVVNILGPGYLANTISSEIDKKHPNISGRVERLEAFFRPVGPIDELLEIPVRSPFIVGTAQAPIINFAPPHHQQSALREPSVPEASLLSKFEVAPHDAAIRQSDASRRQELQEEVLGKARKATESNPGNSFAWSGWGGNLLAFARYEPDASRKRTLLEEACDKYQKALEIDPDHQYARDNLKESLQLLAALKESASNSQEPPEKGNGQP
jgi:tetratricopeptide (TPR) repeat protein